MEKVFVKVTCRDRETGHKYDQFFSIDPIAGFAFDPKSVEVLSNALLTREQYLNVKLDNYFEDYKSSVQYTHSCEDRFLSGDLSADTYRCCVALNREHIEAVKKQLRSVVRRMLDSGYEVPRKEVIFKIIEG